MYGNRGIWAIFLKAWEDWTLMIHIYNIPFIIITEISSQIPSLDLAL